MKTTKVLVLLITVLAGCQPTSPPDLSAIQIELNALKRELEFVRYQTEDLDPRVRLSEQLAMQAIDEKEAPFRLDCLGHTPGIVVTRLTVLATHCETAQARPGGYRLQLQVGNPTSARIDGLKLTLYAGPGAASGRSDRRVFVEAPLPLAPGAWTPVVVEFDDVESEQLAELAIRAQVDRISLAHR